MKTDTEKVKRISMVSVSTLGTTVISTTIFHSSYMKIIPFTQVTAGLILVFPALFLGLMNEEIKESMVAMVLTVIGTVLLTIVTRSVPAFIDILPVAGNRDVFVFQQIGESLPLFFLMILLVNLSYELH